MSFQIDSWDWYTDDHGNLRYGGLMRRRPSYEEDRATLRMALSYDADVMRQPCLDCPTRANTVCRTTAGVPKVACDSRVAAAVAFAERMAA